MFSFITFLYGIIVNILKDRLYILCILTIIPFIKAITGENIQGVNTLNRHCRFTYLQLTGPVLVLMTFFIPCPVHFMAQ